MKLSGQEKKELQEALIDAFPEKKLLEKMLDYGLEKNLDEIAGESNLKTIIFDLIKAADSQGWVENLISAAREENHGNSLLKDIAEKLLKPSTLSGVSYSDIDSDIERCLPSRYNLIERLSESNKVSVYKAHDKYLKRSVAIKVFYSDDLASKENFKKSVIEAVPISNEQNFITIYDAGFEGKYYYYTMQFIDGYTIREYINKNKEEQYILTYQDICSIFIKIGNALIASRNMGFSYKNIKPSNILLVKDKENHEYEPFIAPLSLSEEPSRETILKKLKELQAQQAKKYPEELIYLIPEQFISGRGGHLEFKQSAQYSLGILA